MKKAFVSEIYTSIQGEGPYTGERQIFLRLAGCPLRCNYCDTPDSLIARGHPQMTVSEVVAEIMRNKKVLPALSQILEKRGIRQAGGRVNTVSVTGGEPLIYSTFLKDVFVELKKKRFRIYLETAGVHPEHLKDVVDYVDVIAMDIKLPSATGKSFWKAHKQFLEIGRDKIFTKVVVEKRSRLEEIKKVVKLIRGLKRPPLLVLQPASASSSLVEAPTADQLSDAYALAKNHLPQVLIMPQQHKIWGVR